VDKIRAYCCGDFGEIRDLNVGETGNGLSGGDPTGSRVIRQKNVGRRLKTKLVGDGEICPFGFPNRDQRERPARKGFMPLSLLFCQQKAAEVAGKEPAIFLRQFLVREGKSSYLVFRQTRRGNKTALLLA